MAVWPHPELSDYVCLIPAHEHDDESLKEIEIERQQKSDPTKAGGSSDPKTEVKPAKKEKKEVKGLDLEPKTPEKMKQKE